MRAATSARPAGNGRGPSARRDLAVSLWDGVFFSLMVGLGETYLPAFALALGHGDVIAGLVASVPMMIGAALQLAGPGLVARLGSNKRLVVRCALVQGLSLLPLAAAAATGHLSVVALFAVAAVYWAAGLGAGPAWTSWVPHLVPRRVRARYFAYRTRASQAAVLIGLASAGTALELGGRHGRGMQVFAALFALACLVRLVSTALLSHQREEQRLPHDWAPLSVRAGVRRLASPELRRAIAFLLAMQLAVQFAAPYFSPFMLRELALSYAGYMALIATAYLARALCLPLWGSLAHRVGAQRLLWIGGAGVSLAALPWALTDRFGWLLAAQAWAGAVWAAYELALFLVLFDRLPDRERTSLLALYNLANALALGIGSILGAIWLAQLQHTRTAYLGLFGLTTALRLAALLLAPRLRDGLAALPREPLGTRTLAVRPSAGAIDRPILPEEGRS